MWSFKSKPHVFLCTVPGNTEREDWLVKVTAAWYELGCPVTVLTPGSEGKQQFQRQRRITADEKGGNIYVLADDDCLPLTGDSGEDFVAGMVDTLKRHPQFAILAPMPSNEGINAWTPDVREDKYEVETDSEVMEHVSVGGIRFCRKGVMGVWPQIPEVGGYDGIQGDYLREHGQWRVGYAKNYHFKHLGKDKSTVWIYT